MKVDGLLWLLVSFLGLFVGGRPYFHIFQPYVMLVFRGVNKGLVIDSLLSNKPQS